MSCWRPGAVQELLAGLKFLDEPESLRRRKGLDGAARSRQSACSGNFYMILCLGTTPAAQRVMIFRELKLDAVNRAVTTLDGVAGKSVNVAKVLQVLGAELVATGFLGGPRGHELAETLASRGRGLTLDFVTVRAPTRQCVTVIDQASGAITELVEESRPVEASDFDELFCRFEKWLPKCQAVVLSGTIATGGPSDFYARCTGRAHERGLLTVVDASGAALREALAARPGLIKPNWAELEATVGESLPDEASACAAIRTLYDRGAERIVVTAGAKPALAFDGKCFFRVSVPRVNVVNPIGSGDAFTAGLVWRLTQGADFAEACRWGCAAGAANALTPMAGEVEPSRVEQLAREVRVELISGM